MQEIEIETSILDDCRKLDDFEKRFIKKGDIPGLIYFFWKAGKGGKCPICGGKNWGKPE